MASQMQEEDKEFKVAGKGGKVKMGKITSEQDVLKKALHKMRRKAWRKIFIEHEVPKIKQEYIDKNMEKYHHKNPESPDETPQG